MDLFIDVGRIYFKSKFWNFSQTGGPNLFPNADMSGQGSWHMCINLKMHRREKRYSQYAGERNFVIINFFLNWSISCCTHFHHTTTHILYHSNANAINEFELKYFIFSSTPTLFNLGHWAYINQWLYTIYFRKLRPYALLGFL